MKSSFMLQRSKSLRVWSLLILLLFLSGGETVGEGNRPWGTSTSASVEKRIDRLLAEMTLEEKLGQLQQLNGGADGNYRPEHLELVRTGRLGSIFNVRGAKRTNELQRVAINESRLKIPLLFAFDVVHGYRTIFPVPLAEASSWDPVAVERAAAIAAAESAACGLHWTFAPMLDVARDPRWGRIVEGSGEDPYLGAVMARARVRGFQGSDPSAPDKVLACAKHWVAYGAAEAGRDYNTTDLTERTLREVYFPPFRAALEAGVGSFMTAFNDLDGIPATANPFTLKRVLRQEWEFKGLVVSDYGSVGELINHGLAADGKDAAHLALNAGLDMEMVTRFCNEHGAELISQGKVSVATIDEAVRRILRTKIRLGLFERPYTDESLEQRVLLCQGNLSAAREIASRSMVLLKNQGNVLPLSKQIRSVALIGPLVDDAKTPLGSWLGDGRPEDVVTVLAGIKGKLRSDTRLLYARGCEIEGTSTEGIGEAEQIAREADVAVVVVGESAEMSGEAASRASLDLPGKQLELVKAIHATGTPTVVVLMNGRPLVLNWIAENVPAVLETWFAGTQAGHAIADVLFGDVNPGGKLPVTFPRSVGQAPLYYNHKSTGRPPSEQKYTSKYLDVPVTPLFPFGYGLSYTEFALTDLQISPSQAAPNQQVEVSVLVKNIGPHDGDEVVQLYIRDPVASVTRPVKELKGFERISLRSGEKRRVSFRLTPEALGFLNRDLRFVVEPGEFLIMVGTSSDKTLSGKLVVDE